MLKQINPVWFNYNGKAEMPTDERAVGIIAQEMKEIAPYTIGSFVYQDDLGNKTEYLNYDGNAVTYIIINAIKEQQEIIENQNEKLTKIQSEIEELKLMIQNNGMNQKLSTVKLEGEISKGIILNQNEPNPFTESTTITYFIPDNVINAQLLIYDYTGELVKEVKVERGLGEIKVFASDLSSGIYSYSLIAEGQVISTKKMILVK